MGNDRELLEMAAKAAGMHILPSTWPEEDGWFFCLQHDKPALHFRKVGNPHYHSDPWMPLHDDGDALRLAVKLRLNLYTSNVFFDGLSCQAECPGGLFAIQEHHGEPYAATRRAIVRAAAAIGKAIDA
jgi:hypothetical protein